MIKVIPYDVCRWLRSQGYNEAREKRGLFWKHFAIGPGVVTIFADLRQKVYDAVPYPSFYCDKLSGKQGKNIAGEEARKYWKWIFSLGTYRCEICHERIELKHAIAFAPWEEDVDLYDEWEVLSTPVHAGCLDEVIISEVPHFCNICQKKLTWENMGPDSLVRHHISYQPEVLIDLCRSCHTKLHKGSLPDYRHLLPGEEWNEVLIALKTQQELDEGFKQTIEREQVKEGDDIDF